MLPVWYKKGSVSPLILLLVIGVVVGSAGVMNPGLCQVTNPDSSERLVSSEGVSLEVIEASLEHANWERLGNMLAPTPEAESLICSMKPELRFLKGHALLATNRNNEATVCFACADDTIGSPALNDWQTWTKNLVRQHPTWPSVRYLYADALARLGLLDEAAFELDQVLAISPKDYLARNARGVVRWILGAQDSTVADLQDSAIVDFQIAAQQPDFADAWANLGVLDLYQGFDPEHAKGNFEQALNRDSSFALAVNGRACALGSSGDLKQARRDIERAKRLCSAVGFVAANAAAMSRSADTTSVSASVVAQPGMTKHRGSRLYGHSVEFGWSGMGPHMIWKYTFQRGGIYVLLKEGENLVLDSEGNPRVIGTWFVLNYPLAK